MKAQQKKLSGCASNLLAHEDLGHIEEAHRRNIQAKFYNEKFPLIWKWQHKRLTIWRTLCYVEAQVWKRIVTLSPFLFSSFLIGLSFFGLYFFLFFIGLFLPFFFFLFWAFPFFIWPFSFFYLDFFYLAFLFFFQGTML